MDNISRRHEAAAKRGEAPAERLKGDALGNCGAPLLCVITFNNLKYFLHEVLGSKPCCLRSLSKGLGT